MVMEVIADLQMFTCDVLTAICPDMVGGPWIDVGVSYKLCQERVKEI